MDKEGILRVDHITCQQLGIELGNIHSGIQSIVRIESKIDNTRSGKEILELKKALKTAHYSMSELQRLNEELASKFYSRFSICQSNMPVHDESASSSGHLPQIHKAQSRLDDQNVFEQIPFRYDLTNIPLVDASSQQSICRSFFSTENSYCIKSRLPKPPKIPFRFQ
jgi:hypothetical protein